MPDSFQSDVFLGHNAKDKAVVRPLPERLRVDGVKVEKFPQADPTLTTQMKSVGEAMAIGRTFKESLQKRLRSLETR